MSENTNAPGSNPEALSDQSTLDAKDSSRSAARNDALEQADRFLDLADWHVNPREAIADVIEQLLWDRNEFWLERDQACEERDSLYFKADCPRHLDEIDDLRKRVASREEAALRKARANLFVHAEINQLKRDRDRLIAIVDRLQRELDARAVTP